MKNTEEFSESDLIQANTVITSLTHKCEESLKKLTKKNSQTTLLINRIRGLKIALTLIQKEIEANTKSLPKE